ncbi:MAG TPA: hypothetical protein VGQ24_16460 [Gemmatimonadales bacterium]|jgi:hypothetical protein|nr:hypothetical protein [Gemmatimonadales bacterium]
MGSVLAAVPRLLQEESLFAGFMIASAAETAAGEVAALHVVIGKGG